MKKIKFNSNKGITLIALIITVIVLLILAGTAISISINGGDIFGRASQARESWNTAVANEQNKINEVWNILDSMTGGNGEATPTTTPEDTPTPTPAGITMTLKANNEATGTEVTITEANFAQHLGKIVTNYSGAPTTVTVGSNIYNVSNTYRLYWIDWTNKYGDGAGTIYLKADCTSDNNFVQGESTGATIDAVSAYNSATPKIRNLNPEMYKTGKTPPAVGSENMEAVRWLTNPNNWNSLKTGVNTSIANKVNYVIGAPSLEMMMDSYNAHYNLTGDTPDYSDITAGTRRKIFYTYPLGSYNYGYVVGPNADNDVEYSTSTSNNSVYTDSSIDGMYYPGTNNYYWLASPSDYSSLGVMCVNSECGGFVYYGDISNDCNAFCPLVSLQSDVQL